MKNWLAIGASALLATASAGALLATSGVAQAADMPGAYSTPIAPASYGAYAWTGPYIGANIGYTFGSVSGSSLQPSGVAGGLQAGYNWQSGQLVLGVETDLQLTGADDTLAPWKFSNPWFGTTRGRLGFAMNNILLYGTGGLAYGGLRAEGPGVNQSESSIGWTMGAGIEVALNQNWSAKAEYLFYSLNNNTYTTIGTHGLDANVLRFGVNYHF